jgi:pyruvate/2-oxoglutarate dehydrogenase complex dihydrolipoamide acyltransferase (E2) component
MAIDLKIPSMGQGMSEGTLNEWLASDGAQVSEGEAIYSLESEKSTLEIESPASGVLRIVAEAGETYPVGTVIGRIE